MARQNIERQQDLEPKRIQIAIDKLRKAGYEIVYECPTRVEFLHKGEIVRFFPYSGWHTGKSITDGRGIKNLLKQLTEQCNMK